MILQETERSRESVDPTPPKLRDWWSPAIDARRLRLLLQRRNVPGLLFLGTWLAGVSITTTLLAVFWGGSLAIPMLVVHGGVLSFAYAASHELAHGTAQDLMAE